MAWEEQVGISEMFFEFHLKHRKLASVTSYCTFLFDILKYYEENVLIDEKRQEQREEQTNDAERFDNSNMWVGETSDDIEVKRSDIAPPRPTTLEEAAQLSEILAQQTFPGYLRGREKVVENTRPCWKMEDHINADTSPWKSETMEEESKFTESCDPPGEYEDSQMDFPAEVMKTSSNADHSKRYEGNKCNICHQVFVTKFTLKEHTRQHTGEKPFLCHLCPKSFKWRSSLSAHLRIHAGIRAHKCPVCERAFTEKNAMTKHLRIHVRYLQQFG